MESLRFVERDGQKFYCFIEVCATLFPLCPKSTVRNWLKTLKIVAVNCSCVERNFFRMANPTLGGTFGLILQDDVIRLMEYHSWREQKSPNKRIKIDNNSLAAHPTSTITTAATATATATTTTITTPTTSLDSNSAAEPMTSESSICCNRSKLVEYSVSSSDDEKNSARPPLLENADKNKEAVRLRQTPVSRRNSSILSPDECPDSLKTELKELREFYTKPLNPLRPATAFSAVTMDKLVERLLGFMFFCHKIKNVVAPLSLLLFNDCVLYTSYIEYLRDVRKLNPSTIVNFLSAAINVVKYNMAKDDPSADPNLSQQLKAYHSFQRDFQRQSIRLSKLRKEGLFDRKSDKAFYFAHVLQTLRNLREKYLESKGMKKARHLHNFVLLALYLRATPGRSKEMRTLLLYLESEQKGPFDFSRHMSGNFLVFEPGLSVVYLIQSDFKTAKVTGPTRLELTADEELVYYLKLYVNARPMLLLGKTHDYFFVNMNGEPFLCSSSIAKYIGDIFEREVSIRASTNALRHALVTYFCSLDESADENVRKSLAYLMKHSVRYQQSVYNDQTHEDKTQAGRNLLREKITTGMFGDDDVILRDDVVCSGGGGGDGGSQEKAEIFDGEEVELQPEVGDVVALLDGASTRRDVRFFLAKIARYTKDRKEVHLMHLAAVDDSESLFVMKPGKVWKESANALVFPLDVVYNQSKNAYELRTSAKDIFNCVHGCK